MRKAVIALTVLCFLPAWGDESAGTSTLAPGCEKWVINGYWAGMSMEEAEKVRPIGKQNKKTDLYDVDKPSGRLFFDSSEKMRLWARVLHDTLVGPLIEVLSDRLGEPHSWGTSWESHECNARVVIQTVPTKGRPVHIFKLGTLTAYWKEEEKYKLPKVSLQLLQKAATFLE